MKDVTDATLLQAIASASKRLATMGLIALLYIILPSYKQIIVVPTCIKFTPSSNQSNSRAYLPIDEHSLFIVDVEDDERRGNLSHLGETPSQIEVKDFVENIFCVNSNQRRSCSMKKRNNATALIILLSRTTSTTLLYFQHEVCHHRCPYRLCRRFRPCPNWQGHHRPQRFRERAWCPASSRLLRSFGIAR